MLLKMEVKSWSVLWYMIIEEDINFFHVADVVCDMLCYYVQNKMIMKQGSIYGNSHKQINQKQSTENYICAFVFQMSPKYCSWTGTYCSKCNKVWKSPSMNKKGFVGDLDWNFYTMWLDCYTRTAELAQTIQQIYIFKRRLIRNIW